METVTVSEAKAKMHDITNLVQIGKKQVTITRHGKPAAVLVPIEDVALFEKLIERFEDEEDVQTALAALNEPGENISHEDLKKELGLSV